MKEIIKDNIEMILMIVAILIVMIGLLTVVINVEKIRANYITQAINYAVSHNMEVEIK